MFTSFFTLKKEVLQETPKASIITSQLSPKLCNYLSRNRMYVQGHFF